MNFAEKLWLFAALGCIPLLVFLFYQIERVKERILHKFAADKLLAGLAASYSPFKRHLKGALIITAAALMMLTLARPQWGYVWQETKGKGIDILIALDTSRSMLAEDIQPNRLERAKLAIMDLVARAEGDRVGLVAFSGSAFLQCPLTLDYDAYRQTLETVDTSIIPRGGTNLAAAIAEAEAAFSKKDNFKILILITDGEDLEQAGIEKAREAAKSGVKIYPVGVGSRSGELIPVRLPDGSVDFVRDENGDVVKTRLDEATLTTIAQSTGGFYTPLGSTGEGLERVYQEGLRSIPKQEREARLQQVPQERFQVPLGIAVAALFFESILGTRRRKNTGPRSIPLQWAAILVFTCALFFTFPLHGSIGDAEELYNEENYGEAVDQYRQAVDKSPDDPRLHYNLGASQFRLGNFEGAREALEAALQTDDPNLQRNTYYNLGNTRFRLGESSVANDPEKTIESWEEGLRDYQNALQINPEDADAQYNHDLLQQRLEELKKQQQQQQQSDDQNEDQEEQDQEEQPQDQEGDEQNQQESDQGQQEDQQTEPQEGESGDENEQSEGQENEEQEQQAGEESGAGEPEESPSQPAAQVGLMTPEEAEQLLDAMKADEKKLPVGVINETEAGGKKSAPLRDW